jgi:hypothetical protein
MIRERGVASFGGGFTCLLISTVLVGQVRMPYYFVSFERQLTISKKKEVVLDFPSAKLTIDRQTWKTG